MTPLMLRIMTGQEDTMLLHHISALEAMSSGRNGSAGISERERATLALAYERLEFITRP